VVTTEKSFEVPFFHLVPWYKIPSLSTNNCFFHVFPEDFVHNNPSARDDLHKSDEKKVFKSVKRDASFCPEQFEKDFKKVTFDYYRFQRVTRHMITICQISLRPPKDIVFLLSLRKDYSIVRLWFPF